MSIGKLKMKLSFFMKKEFTFYEYARHTLASSGQLVSFTMKDLYTDPSTQHIVYFQTKNFYIQLLAAYSASYYFFPYFRELVPVSLLESSLREMVQGRDVGIDAWTFDNTPIEGELVEKYKIGFKRYYNSIMHDCNKINDSAFNPDINEFSKHFVQDSIYLMESESGTSINEVERTLLTHVIADIPLSVFKELSSKSVEYIR